MNTFDLFVSYSRRDNQEGRVTGLVEQISQDFAAFAGRPLRPFFDAQEIHGMDDWRHRILRGLRESRLLIALLSPSYFQSQYCEWEVNEYLKHEIGEGLVSEGIAPVYFVGVDWRNQTVAQESAQWIGELRRRQYFDLKPWFQDGQQALRDLAVRQRMTALTERICERVRRGELSENAKGNVPRFNVNFSGRTAEMRMLRESVSLKQVGILTAVQGLGGIGKTALACAYAHTYGAEYPGGCWQVNCEGREDLRAALVALTGARDFNFDFTNEEKRNLDLAFERVLREFKKRAEAASPGRVLVILDNVDKPELLAPAQVERLPRADWLHFIATTRLGEAELGRGPNCRCLTIDELPEKDAVDLIEKWQPEGSFPNQAERDAAHGIARLLGGFTLAVEAAAVYLCQNGGQVTCAGLEKRLEREGLGGLEAAASDPAVRLLHEEKRLSTTLQPTLDHLSPPEKLVLMYAALLPPEFVVLPWIRPLVALPFPEVGRDAEPGYPDPWSKILGKLISFRFLQPTARLEVVRVHRLVQELVRRQAQTAELDPLESHLIGKVRERGKFLAEHWADPQSRWELEPVAISTARWLAIETRELDAAEIASSLAEPLRRLARYGEAEQLCRQALAIREKHLSPDHPDVAESLNNLALVFSDTARWTEAKALYLRALAIQETCPGCDPLDLADTLHNLAFLLNQNFRLDEAESLYRRALKIRENRLGPDDLKVAATLANLAAILISQSRNTEAEKAFRRALTIRETALGPDHPEVADTLTDLACLLQETGRQSDAAPLFRRALTIREKSLGPEHPAVAQALNNLAVILNDAAHSNEVEQLYRRALAIREKSLGPDNPEVARSLGNLATFYLSDQSRRPEVEQLYRRALAINEKSFGPNHPEVSSSLYNLAFYLQMIGREDEAAPLFKRAEALAEKIVRREHPFTYWLKKLIGKWFPGTFETDD